jgi:hypothetical protein
MRVLNNNFIVYSRSTVDKAVHIGYNVFMMKKFDTPYIPKDLPIEQLRKWLAAKIEELDKTKREIRQSMEERKGNPEFGSDWFIRAKDKVKYLNVERQFYKDRIGEVKKEIKQRNIEKHSLGAGQVNIFIEMAKLLEEKYPEIYDGIYDEALCNLDIRERKSHSGYLKSAVLR